MLRAVSFDQSPEISAVIHIDQMAEFVDQDIIYTFRRVEDDVLVYRDVPGGGAAPPARGHLPDGELSRAEACLFAKAFKGFRYDLCAALSYGLSCLRVDILIPSGAVPELPVEHCDDQLTVPESRLEIFRRTFAAEGIPFPAESKAPALAEALRPYCRRLDRGQAF